MTENGHKETYLDTWMGFKSAVMVKSIFITTVRIWDEGSWLKKMELNSQQIAENKKMILLSQILSVNFLWLIHLKEEQLQCERGVCADKGYDTCGVCANCLN